MGVNLKKMAAEAAMDWVKPGMKLGLGTGSTANDCLLYTSPSPRDLSTSRMPSSA